MAAASERARAWDQAVRALERRDRTVHEMRETLRRRGCAPDAIEAAIEDLRSEGLLDDRRYAERLIDDRRRLDGWGPVRIALDLERRGVDPGIVEDALRGSGGDELATAMALLETRVAAIADDRDRNRAWGLLVRRGYEPELAYAAIREHEQRLAA